MVILEGRRGLGNTGASQVVLVVQKPVNAGDLRDAGSTPGSGGSLGRGHENPLQCSCLENPMDRGAWLAAVHGVTKNRTQLSNEHSHFLL